MRAPGRPVALAIATIATVAAFGCSPVTLPEPLQIEPELRAIESNSGGRLGVALTDHDGRLLAAHRPGERFAFCSTFKLLLAARVLDGASEGRWSLDELLPVARPDIVFHSPITETRVGEGIAIQEASRAIVTVSDNAAANLLVARTGGIQAFNLWLRGLGDPVTRLDRPEPSLNENRAGDPRDTTSPEAMARSAAEILFGKALRKQDRDTLREWLIESRTGLRRIRSGLPPPLVAGDKTGTCGARGRSSYNDVAFIMPERAADGRGYVLAIFLDGPAGDADAAESAIADVARVAARSIMDERSN